MRLSSKSEYGVRAIVDMVSNSEGLPVQIKDISRRQRIPHRYLVQIFQRLKRTGILRSIRGPNGGYLLTRKPEEITIGDIVRSTYGPIEPISCLRTGRKQKRCVLEDTCVTKPIWKETGDRITEFFNSITILDLIKKEKSLKKIISLS